MGLAAIGANVGGDNVAFAFFRATQNCGTGAVPEENAGVAVFPVDEGREFFGADNERVFEGAVGDESLGNLHRVDEARARCGDVERYRSHAAQVLLNIASGGGGEGVGGDGGDDDELQVFCGDAGLFERFFSRFGGHVRGELVFGGDAALFDAGSARDPFVGGFNKGFEFGISENFFRKVTSRPGDHDGNLGLRFARLFAHVCFKSLRPEWGSGKGGVRNERKIESGADLANLCAMPMKVEDAQGLLESAHERGRLAHALILSGPVGSGKAELAANLIQHINKPAEAGADLWGEPVEEVVKPLAELEGEFVRIVRPKSRSRRIKVEQMREIEKPLHLAAPEGVWKVGVILDADRMGDEAANAFLKTLEEPPDNCLLLLLTASPARLLPTILSRCVEISLTNRRGMEERLADRTKDLERALAEIAHNGPSTWAALGVKASFEEILANWKKEREKEFADELKAENAHYKNASEGKWLEEREEAMKAELAGELIEARQSLVQWLSAWMGDAVRAKFGSDRFDLPGQKGATSWFGKEQELSALLRRTDALKEMASLLETNAQETLVLETCLLGAFS